MKVEEYRPEEENRKHAAVIFLYGADGLKAEDSGYRRMARWIAARGYDVFLVDYFGGGSLPSFHKRSEQEYLELWLDTIDRAVTIVRKKDGIDKSRVACLGISLGGSLSMIHAIGDERVRAQAILFGELPEPYQDRTRFLPPTLLIHGGADELVPVAASKRLAAALEREGVPFELKIYPREPHGFAMRQPDFTTIDVLKRIVKFFDKKFSV